MYLLDVLGHPFGKAPSPKPFEADYEESKIILTDPINPLGKDVLAGVTRILVMTHYCYCYCLFFSSWLQYKGLF